jgi:hypothetical protein
MSQRGDESTAAWDFQVTAISPKFDHYKIRATGDTGAGVDFAAPAWPREVLGGAFGSAVQFQVQGCTSWNVCGPWYDKAAPEESLSFAMTGLQYDATTGTFAWTNGPANGKLTASYRCFADTDSTDAGTGQATDPDRVCAIPGFPTTGTVHLVVTVNERNYTYDR